LRLLRSEGTVTRVIPSIAVIIATYAVARLLNEYVLNQPKSARVRGVIALIAIAIIVLFVWSVINSAGFDDLRL
jgi:predicted acyltransferase